MSRWIIKGLFSRRRSDRIFILVVLVALAGYWAWKNWWPQIPQATIMTGGGGLEVYFPPNQGKQAKRRLIGLMDGAKTRIDMAALELDDLELGQALRRAAKRGVQVRMMNDSDYRLEAKLSLGAKSSSQARCEVLQGVQACFDRRESALMHHKFVIIDELGVWSGSTNMTEVAFARNNENSLWFPISSLVKTYRNEFEAVFSGNEQGLGQSQSFQVGSTAGRVYFSPAGGRLGRTALLGLTDKAKQEIWVAAYVLTDNKIVESLVRAHRRGVRVRAVLDARSLENSKDESLSRAGIDVRKDGNPYTMHNKVMVVDGEWVATGSYNFTNSGFGRNNENLLILQDKNLASRYQKEVQSIWQVGSRL